MKEFPKQVFVTGIGTDVGKTIVSAVLVEALQADYWKPVQSGNLLSTDTGVVLSLISNTISKIHQEAYSLKAATVPSYAASLENINIESARITSTPDTANSLIIEGAGGLMVHLRDDFMVIDLICQLNIPIILVSENYLGSINHTLLSIEALKSRNIPILGIIYNGDPVDHVRALISHSSKVPVLGSIDRTEKVDKKFIKHEADKLLSSLRKHCDIP